MISFIVHLCHTVQISTTSQCWGFSHLLLSRLSIYFWNALLFFFSLLLFKIQFLGFSDLLFFTNGPAVWAAGKQFFFILDKNIKIIIKYQNIYLKFFFIIIWHITRHIVWVYLNSILKFNFFLNFVFPY